MIAKATSKATHNFICLVDMECFSYVHNWSLLTENQYVQLHKWYNTTSSWFRIHFFKVEIGILGRYTYTDLDL